jgi:transposase
MPLAQKVSSDEIIQILQELQVETNLQKVAQKFGRSYETVRRIRNGTLHSKKKSHPKKRGRKSKLTDRDARVINRCVMKMTQQKKKVSPGKIVKELNLPVSRTCVARVLQKKGFRAKKILKKPMISERNKKIRMEFAENHFRRLDWTKVLWSDEKKFKLDCPDGNIYLWRIVDPSDPRYVPEYNLWRRQKGGGGVLVWASFSALGTGNLVFTEETMDGNSYRKMMQEFMLPYFNQNRAQFNYFMQDNAPPHTTKVNKKWFARHNIPLLDWPACSPDLNPIENLWQMLSDRIYANVGGFSSIAQLKNAIEREWDKVTIDECKKLVNSIDNRCLEVIKSHGNITKY